jgi:hypothetical protein
MQKIWAIEGPLNKEHCTCNGRCGTCVEAVGFDEDLVCPYCPIHGEGPIAKRRRQIILENIY